ncbi:MAG: class I SAM-dependent methyltransferase [Planctomycetes bacterium]|nr:class I SAM-dependent methyltransferase [Planctomycetota bacterium]
MSARSKGLYDDPEIYDILHEPGTAGEIRMLERIWRRACVGAPRAALEPACGTGRYLERLAAKGWRVLGFDIDPSMVRYASRRLRHAASGSHVWVDRFESFGRKVAPDSIGLAFCPINSIRHVGSDREMVAHLAAVRRALAPQGAYAVGMSLGAYGLEAPTEDVWTGRRAKTRVKQVVSYTPAKGSRSPAARAERVDSVLEIRRGRRCEVRSSSYSLLTYSREQWECVIARAGLRVIGMVNENAVRFDPGEIGYGIWILARKDHPLASITGSARNG